MASSATVLLLLMLLATAVSPSGIATCAAAADAPGPVLVEQWKQDAAVSEHLPDVVKNATTFSEAIEAAATEYTQRKLPNTAGFVENSSQVFTAIHQFLGTHYAREYALIPGSSQLEKLQYAAEHLKGVMALTPTSGALAPPPGAPAPAPAPQPPAPPWAILPPAPDPDLVRPDASKKFKFTKDFLSAVAKAKKAYDKQDGYKDEHAFSDLVAAALLEYAAPHGVPPEMTANAAVAEIKLHMPIWGTLIDTEVWRGVKDLYAAANFRGDWFAQSVASAAAKSARVTLQTSPLLVGLNGIRRRIEYQSGDPQEFAQKELRQLFNTLKSEEDKKVITEAITKHPEGTPNRYTTILESLVAQVNAPLTTKQFSATFIKALHGNTSRLINYSGADIRSKLGAAGDGYADVSEIAAFLPGLTPETAALDLATVEKNTPDKIVGDGRVNYEEAAALALSQFWKDYPEEMKMLNPVGAAPMSSSKSALAQLGVLIMELRRQQTMPR